MQDNFLNALLVLLVEVGKRTILRVLGIKRMSLKPTAGGIVIKIVTRLDRSVKVLRINARRQVGLCQGTHCHKDQSQKEYSFLHM